MEGTRHVIEFANSHEVGRFHHTSSIAVAGEYRGVFQEDMFDEGQRLPHHYHRTKYESERLVRDAVQAKTLVFRPGIVRRPLGDRRDGQDRRSLLLLQAAPAAARTRCPSGCRWPARRAATPTSCRWTSSRARWTTSPTCPDDDLPGDTFHLVNPEPMTVGETLNEFAKAAHAPQLAMRVDANVTNAIPKPVRAGLMALPTVKRIRNQIYHDLGIPPAAMENRDFNCKFDARDAQRALAGTGIAVPPLSHLRAARCGTTGSATSTRTCSASAAWRARSRASGS